jgi:hypothetical protein
MGEGGGRGGGGRGASHELKPRRDALSSILHLSLILLLSIPYLSIKTTDTWEEAKMADMRFVIVLKNRR